jgi:histidinol-phosphate aminotransferase
MSRYWSEVVRQLEPYVPGEQPQIDGLIKLNTNENPYPPSPRVHQLLNEQACARLRLYPDPNSLQLKKAIAGYYQVQPDQVFIGNGSDEVLALLFMAFFKQAKPILFPDITYSFYKVYCQLFQVNAQVIPLRDDFTIDFADYPSENGGIIFPNPNAPTAMGKSLAEIESLLQRNPDSVVVVDEAYIDFGGESAIALIDRYPNLLVVQTLSKSRALAGMRVGFAVGNSELINGLDRVKNSFNSYPLDRLAEVAAVAAFEDEDYFQESRQKVIATRERTREQLEAMGFVVLPSQANFLFVQPPGDAAELMAYLRANKILVRHFSAPRIQDFLRITIGTDAEMEQLISVLRAR